MSKNVIILAVLIGVVITAVSYLYTKETLGQYCSPDPEINSRADCSGVIKNHGYPAAYYINPDFQPKHGLQVPALIIDTAVWSVAAGLVVFTVRKLRA